MKKTTYYSIRVITAKNKEKAVDQIEDGMYDETDDICDQILTKEELIERLTPNSNSDLFKNIDFKLLRKQKKELLKIKNNSAIEGILSLIDEIQDIAVDQQGRSEKEVFGKTYTKKK